MLKSYRELVVWRKSIELVIEIYRLTSLFPKLETYGLVAQMRRAAVSIPSNVAEGYTRKYRQEYHQFLRIAFGSGAELETQIVIAKKLDFAPAEKFRKSESLPEEVMKMLNKMTTSVIAKP